MYCDNVVFDTIKHSVESAYFQIVRNKMGTNEQYICNALLR